MKPATALRVKHKAPVRAIVARIPEAQGPGSLALLKRGQCDPFKERGRNGTALAGTLNGRHTTIGRASLEFGEIMQSWLAVETGRLIAHRFDAQGTPFFEVLFDPRVLVEDVDDEVHATGD